MNRALSTDAGGAFVLSPQRRYRAVLVITGETSLEDLEEELIRLGFDPGQLASSPPGAWAQNRPEDWPQESPVELCVNECLVRISGLFRGPTRIIRKDTPILDETGTHSGASFSVAQCWDHAVSIAHDTGAAASSPATKHPGDYRGVAILAAAVGMLGVGIVSNIRSERRAAQENARLRSAMEREERNALEQRTHELMRQGRTRQEASAIAHEELTAANLVVFEAPIEDCSDA